MANSAYLKNLAKSFGYAAADTFSSYIPVVGNMSRQAKDITRELKDGIDNLKNSKDKIAEVDMQKETSTIVNNTLDDLLSGNWYNKERMKKDEESGSMLGDLDFDFDMDFSFDDNEDDIKESVDDIKSVDQMLNGMDDVGSRVAGAVTNATTTSADYIAKSARVSSRALYSLTDRGFNQVSRGLLAINSNMETIVALKDPLLRHMESSANFFTTITDKINSIDDTLKTIAKNTTPAPEAKGSYRRKTGTFGDVFTDDGIDFSFYVDMFKKAGKDYAEMAGFAKQMAGGTIGSKIKSPLAMVTTFMISGMIPKMMKESMKSFNESLVAMFGAAATKGRNSKIWGKIGTGGGIGTILKNLLFPDDGFKKTINNGNYNKGAVQWDGYSRKALVEVIPTLLAKTYSAISGSPELRYNYETGKFVTIGEIRKWEKERMSTSAKEAGGELRDDLLKKIEKQFENQKEVQEQMKKEMENYFYNAFSKDGSDFTNVRRKDFKKEDFGMSDKSLKILVDMLNDYQNDPKKRNVANKFVNRVGRGRGEYGDKMRQLEANGMDITANLYNGSTETANSITDEYDHSMMFYLQGIYQYTGMLADNIGFLGGKNKTIKRRADLSKGGKVAKANPIVTDTGSFAKTLDEANFENIESKKQKSDFDAAKKDAKKFVDDKFVSKFQNGKSKKAPGKVRRALGTVRNIYEAPAEALSHFIWSTESIFYKAIWGDGEEGGFMGMMKTKLSDTFDKFDKMLEDKFGLGIKSLWTKLVGEKDKDTGKRSGGLISGFMNDTKTELGNAGKWLGNTANQKLGGKKKVETAAYGRKVTKTGIVAVSEGEMIIPSELNPFYNGVTNKRAQKKKEAEVVRNFYGSYDEGSLGVGVKDFAKSGVSTLGGGIQDFIHAIIGSNEETLKKDKDKMGEITKTTMKEAGINKGAIGAGALIGGGVSILTGAVVGPLFGAAIGGAVGLAIKSQAVQDILFGKQDENGEYKPGLLPKGVTEFLKTGLKDTTVGAAIGGGAGLLLGSPVLGAILGGAVGYVNSSDKAKKFLFGEEADLKIDKIKKSIKKVSPNLAAGLIAGAVAGPFGSVAANLIIGSGLGLATTSQTFQETILGKKDDKGNRKGGIAGVLHNYFLGKDLYDKDGNPIGKGKDKGLIGHLEGIFTNLAIQLRTDAKNMFKKLGNGIKKMFGGLGSKIFGSKLARWGQTAAKGAAAAIFAPIAAKIGIPAIGIKGLAGIADRRLESRALNKGYNVWNKKEGRYMTAEERNNLRSKNWTHANKNSSSATFDRVLAGTKSNEDLNKIQQQLEAVKSPTKMANALRDKAGSKLSDALSSANISGKTYEKILQYASKGKVDDAESLINKSVESESSRKEIMDALNSYIESNNGVKFAKHNRKAASDSLRSGILKNHGIKINSDSDVDKMLDAVKSERSRMKEKTPEEKHAVVVEDYLKSMNEALDIIAHPDKYKKKRNKGKSKQQIQEETKDKLSSTEDVYDSITGEFVHAVRNEQGVLEPDKGTTQNRDSNKNRNKFLSGFTALSGLGTTLSTLFGKKDDDGEPKEKKKSLLSKLLGFGDEEGGGLLSNLFGSKASFLSDIKSFFSPKAIFKGIIGPALLFGAASGKFNGFWDKLTNHKSSDKSNVYAGDKTLETDEKGNPIKDADGNYTATDGSSVSGDSSVKYTDATSKDGLNKSIKKQALRGLATGTFKNKTAAGKLLYSSKYVQKGTKFAAKAASKASGPILKGIANGVQKWAEFLIKHGPGPLKKIAGKIDWDKMVTSITEASAKGMKSGLGKKLTNIAGNAIFVAKIAFVVNDFITGYQDANATWHITKEPSVGQKLVSGMIRSLKNLIPVIGQLIPDKTLIDLLGKFIAPALGISPQELAKDREDADKEVAAYNEKNGTNLSFDEYNKEVLGNYTWTEKVGNTFKSIKQGGVKGAVKGLGNTFKGTVGGAGDVWALALKGDVKGMLAYKYKAPEGAGGIGPMISAQVAMAKTTAMPLAISNALGNAVKNLFNGVVDKAASKMNIGQIVDRYQKYASEGDVIGIMKDKLDEKGDNDNPLSMFSKVAATIAKIFYTVMAGMNFIPANIKKFAGGMWNKFKKLMGLPTDDTEDDTTKEEGQGVNTNDATATKTIEDEKAAKATETKTNSTINTSMTAATTSSAVASAPTIQTSMPVSSVSTYASGGGAFVSQRDPRYSNKSFAGSTVGQLGCAPAAASMMASAMGSNLSMDQAINASKGFQNSNGTTANYFANALGGKGIRTSYMNNPGQIASTIAGGGPVVLLGRDGYNASKAGSPFGPSSHYVVATGTDSKGNIIINDPEQNRSRAYSSSILNSVQMGIGGSYGSGSSPYEDRVWAYFKSKGYSDGATAGIMANLQQESGIDPEKFQNGGPAAGIAQWENYKQQNGRWAQLKAYADSKGRSWKDLTTQLEFIEMEMGTKNQYTDAYSGSLLRKRHGGLSAFKALGNAKDATYQFETTFERAGKPMMENRYKYASDILSKYTGKTIAYTDVPVASDSIANSGATIAATNATTSTGDATTASTDSTSTTDSSTSSTSGLGILSTITSAFSKIGDLFNGSSDSSTDATSTEASAASAETSTVSNYAQGNSGTSTTGMSYAAGLQSANPIGATYSGTSPLDYMKSAQGKLTYDMSGPRNPEKGSSDCSSTIRWAIQKAGGPDIGGNTASQYDDADLKNVWYNNGQIATKLPDNIQPNDILFFSRPNSGYTAGRKDRVGHVEMYAGDGQMIGHGGGIGPKMKSVPLGAGKNGGLIKVSRVAGMSTALGGRGSGLTGGSSGILLNYNPNKKMKSATQISGGSSGTNYTAATKAILHDYTNTVKAGGASGQIDSSKVDALLEAIANILNVIASNTAPTKQIYEVLASYLGVKAKTDSQLAKASGGTTGDDNVSAAIKSLSGALAEIARG